MCWPLFDPSLSLSCQIWECQIYHLWSWRTSTGYVVHPLIFSSFCHYILDNTMPHIACHLWHNYLPEVNDIIFLVDSADYKHFAELKAELNPLLLNSPMFPSLFLATRLTYLVLSVRRNSNITLDSTRPLGRLVSSLTSPWGEVGVHSDTH